MAAASIDASVAASGSCHASVAYLHFGNLECVAMNTRRAMVGMVAAFAILGAASVAAQMPGKGPGMGPGQGMGMGQGMGPGMMGPGMMGRGGMMGGCMMMGERGDAHAAGRVAFLKAELAITEAQQPAFEAYAAALKANLESMRSMHETMRASMEAGSPVDRLATHMRAMEARLASLKQVQPALEKLYGSLDAEQKKKADDVLTGLGCMM